MLGTELQEVITRVLSSEFSHSFPAGDMAALRGISVRKEGVFQPFERGGKIVERVLPIGLPESSSWYTWSGSYDHVGLASSHFPSHFPFAMCPSLYLQRLVSRYRRQQEACVTQHRHWAQYVALGTQEIVTQLILSGREASGEQDLSVRGHLYRRDGQRAMLVWREEAGVERVYTLCSDVLQDYSKTAPPEELWEVVSTVWRRKDAEYLWKQFVGTDPPTT